MSKAWSLQRLSEAAVLVICAVVAGFSLGLVIGGTILIFKRLMCL